MIQELVDVSDICCHGNLVLSLELRPHGAESSIVACCRLDVIHDVQVDIVQVHDHLLGLGRVALVIHDGAKNRPKLENVRSAKTLQ